MADSQGAVAQEVEWRLMEDHSVTLEMSISHPSFGELEAAVRAALDGAPGPWKVVIRGADTPQSTADWSVVVTRPGHVWLMRAAGWQQDPPELTDLIRRSVRPQQFNGEAPPKDS